MDKKEQHLKEFIALQGGGDISGEITSHNGQETIFTEFILRRKFWIQVYDSKEGFSRFYSPYLGTSPETGKLVGA